MTALECCLALGGNGGADGLADTCSDAMVNGVLSDLPMDSACYYYDQQNPSGGGASLESVGNFIESIGSFANNIFSIFGLGPTSTAPSTGGGSGLNPALPPQTQDKSRRNTLLILGLITVVVIGFAVYTLRKKK